MAKFATRIIRGADKIDAAMPKLTASADKVNAFAHSLAMSIAVHAAPKDAGGFGHGDCSRIVGLIAAMPKSMRRDAMIAWFTKYTPIRISSDLTKAAYSDKYGKLDAAKKLSAWKLSDGDADPFYASIADKKDAKAIAFDLAYAMKLLGSTLARIETLAGGDGVNDNAKADALALVGRVRKAEKIAA